MNHYILCLWLLKKSLLPLQKAAIYYVKCKDGTKQGNDILWQELLQKSRLFEIWRGKLYKYTHVFWHLVLFSLKSVEILPLTKQRGGLGPNHAAICQNNQVTGNCSPKGRCVLKLQMPTWS